MTSIQDRLRALKEALVTVSNDCWHYDAPSDKHVPYIVWYEDKEDNPLNLDNHKVRQSISGYVHYYTLTEFDPAFDSIQEALDSIEGCSWSWETTQNGDPTQNDNNIIQYTWSWRLR